MKQFTTKELHKLWESGRVLLQLQNKCSIWTTGEVIFADYDGNLSAVMKNNVTWQWTGQFCPEYAKKEFRNFLKMIKIKLNK